MRRVHVAHFEARALTRQAARAKRRETALVGDLGERVGLVHELRQLRGAEEFAHRGNHRFGVDEVVRHDRVDVDGAHAFLDRALHAHETDAVVVFHQFADRTDAAVAEVVDVVDFALAVLQVEDDLHDADDVFVAQDAHRVFRRLVLAHGHRETHVHLHAADGRKVIALAIEEKLAEQCIGRFLRRRFAGAHDAVDVRERFEARLVLICLERIAQPGTAAAGIDVEYFDHLQPVVAHFGN